MEGRVRQQYGLGVRVVVPGREGEHLLTPEPAHLDPGDDSQPRDVCDANPTVDEELLDRPRLLARTVDTEHEAAARASPHGSVDASALQFRGPFMETPSTAS